MPPYWYLIDPEVDKADEPRRIIREINRQIQTGRKINVFVKINDDDCPKWYRMKVPRHLYFPGKFFYCKTVSILYLFLYRQKINKMVYILMC